MTIDYDLPDRTDPRKAGPFQISLAELLVIVAVIGLFLAGLTATVRSATTSARRQQCQNNLRQIAIALQNYHDVHGSFPPAYFCDNEGTPIHSWRILIAPFLESSPLYSQYRFDEPWDGPNNRLLAQGFRRLYRCPADTSPPGETSYLVVVGDNTLFPHDRSVTLSDIKDGSADTIMVVEVRNSGIHWMEPRDLSAADLQNGIDPKTGVTISSNHLKNDRNAAQVAFADGHVGIVSGKISPDKLRAMLTIAGGEKAVNPSENSDHNP